MNVKVALLNRWDKVRHSYWFVPTLMALGAFLLSFGTLYLDGNLNGSGLGEAWWAYTGSSEGARAVLQTIATSMIGVAGVVFSITTVTLTLAANKFGPRIFRNFMRDPGNQVVLGTFIATFLFCLMILRQVRGSDDNYDRFIPQLSMLIAVILAVFNLGVLIYFIHHVAASIQTPVVIAAIGRDLENAIRNLYPEQIGEAPPREHGDVALAAQMPPRFNAEAVAVRSRGGGYILRLEPADLVELAAERDVLVRVERHPGDFVITDDVLLRVWPADRASDELADSLRAVVALGEQRTPAQDVRFPIGQLTEIACLALSSGVNDLYTAAMCVDRLGEGLALLAGRTTPSPFRADNSGRLRVMASSPDLAALLAVAFDPIRQNGASQPLVMGRLLDALIRIAGQAYLQEDRLAVLAYAEGVRKLVTAALMAGSDRAWLDDALDRLRQTVVLDPVHSPAPRETADGDGEPAAIGKPGLV